MTKETAEETKEVVTKPPTGASALDQEVARRRTFAIISHPDAGKTTLTEKLLLYAGAIDQAGAVRARKQQRQVVSDWMAMEQERGISITSTVLQFEVDRCLFNLLDTPGHQDFSEDTYRTLMAVDSAIMVLDSAKGIEAQTQKLFAVCRQQNLPILTFINKLDQAGRDPLELLDEIERVLSIRAVPMNWPIGSGPDFQGVYDLRAQQILYFQRTARGTQRAPVQVASLNDPKLVEHLTPHAYARLCEEVELINGIGLEFEAEAFAAGELTPVYFGSAVNNFGVEPFLAALTELAPSPRPRASSQGIVKPTDEQFSGFIFKIQANMDPKHRDSMAFLRVCSGHFMKDMTVYHPRLGRNLRMSRPHRLFARERETVETAYAGDVIGLSNPGTFTIGDTVTSGGALQFPPIPSFPPEHFGRLRNDKIEKYKQFNKGLEQLMDEAVVQVLYPTNHVRREPILAVVGTLQFDVVTARLSAEYNITTHIDPLPYVAARWVTGSPAALASAKWPSQSLRTEDRAGNLVLLFTSVWELNYCIENNPQIEFHETNQVG
ncbi:MAG: peptide chain release factor 3 [Caldilineaceae bacterium]|nr:peptide chain release factor 3 [Caldilineaceae bacterium]